MGPKKRRHDPVFRAEVSRRIRAKVKELQKKDKDFSEAAAARQIGVTPQAFNQYMRGLATPTAHTLARACTIWGLRFTYKNVEFGPEAFDAPKGAHEQPHPAQLSLFDEAQELRNRNLNLKVQAGKSTTLNISLDIRFAS